MGEIKRTMKIKSLPDCCDESKQDLSDWIECGFKFCPWCGRELRPKGINIKYADLTIDERIQTFTKEVEGKVL